MGSSESTTTPVVIHDLAEACVKFVQRTLGIELDYTPDTLPILDHYLREAHGVARDEVLRLMAPAAGAYFGEVVRRHLGESRWVLEDGDEFSGARLEFVRCFLSFNPMGNALEAVLGREAEGFGSHLELLPEDRGMVQEALEHAGEVRAEDYFRLAIRYEVLELAVSLLVEKAIQTGALERVYGRDVYEALRDKGNAPVLH